MAKAELVTKPSEREKVNAYMANLKHPLSDVVEALRQIILASDRSYVCRRIGMKHWLFGSLLIFGLAVESCFAQSEAKALPGPTAIVYKLYHDFAWEAVISEPGDKGLLDQPRATLMRYFDSRLTALILNDREYAARTKGIGRLDFCPLWDSQDPGASDLQIGAGKRNTVNVKFRYPGDGSNIKIIYQTTKVSGHWRISDIRYQNGISLLSILESKD